MAESKEFYEFERFRLDVAKQRLHSGSEIISLPPKAIELLTFMVKNQGRILEKEELITTLWQDTFVEESNLTQTIYLLRKALGKNSAGEPLIATLPKRGYKFIPSVHKSPSEEISMTVERKTEEKIFISREETERITTTISRPVDVAPQIISKVQPITATEAKSSIPKKYLVIALVLIAIVSVGAFFFVRSSKGDNIQNKKIKSLVVVPFNLISADDDKKGFLSLGLADTLITRLGKGGKINVRSTEEMQRYSNTATDPLELGRKLNADAVLTGNIQQVEDRVRFNAQLLRVEDGQIIWSNQFDESASDLFALQDIITRRLNDALTLQLTEDEQKHLSQKTTENLDAMKLYWQGRFYWNRRTPEWIRKGIECFEEAIKLDPNYAQAYAGLADSYALSSSGFSPMERFPKAKAAARHALELNEQLAEAHTSLAFVTYKFDWNWKDAEDHFKRAIELNDSYATAHHWYGEFLVLFGRYDEGFSELARAAQLDPFSLAIKTDTAEALYRAGRYDEALAKVREALDIDANYIQVYRILRHIQKQKNEPDAEIIKTDLQIQRLAKIPPKQFEELENLFAKQNWKAYWEKRLEFVSASSEVPYFIEKIELYLKLGEMDKAIEQIKRQIDKREMTPLLLKGEPMLQPLHSNPQIQFILGLGGFTATG